MSDVQPTPLRRALRIGLQALAYTVCLFALGCGQCPLK